MIAPTTSREMAAVLHEAAERRQRIAMGGGFSKRLMAGPNDPAAEIAITTARMDKVLAYEPRDLTISVEAGIPYRKLQGVLAAHRQMIPLDPIFPDRATIGGVVAANVSGPRRRQYGTARDLVIGMHFAMLNGRVVQSGGMVVKNVAGLDMAKLLIGSFGTLAVMTVINFKLLPMPPSERTFAIEFATAAEVLAVRDRLIQGFNPPGAIEVMNPLLASEYGFAGWTLLLWFGGNEPLMERCEREMVSLGPSKTGKSSFWERVQSQTARFLSEHADGAVVRISCLLDEITRVFDELRVPAIARAGTGLVYAYFASSEDASQWLQHASGRGRSAVIEFASEAARMKYDLWLTPGSDFAIMKRVKHLFDPDALLNRGRLYRHL